MKLAQIHVAPAAGRQVRDPADGQALPEEGRVVDHTTYWSRRIADEDVTIVPAPASKKKD